MSALQKTDVIAARLLVMCFFIPARLQVLVAIASCLYFVFRTVAIKSLPPRRNFLFALLLGGGYLLYFFSALFTPPPYKAFAFSLCERMSAFMLLPFVFAITAQQYRLLIVGQLRYFVYGCLIVGVMGNVDFLYHHFIVDGGRNAFSHVRYRMIFEPFTGIHPTYMCVYLAFAICITTLRWNALTSKEKLLKSITTYTLLLLLLALFAKSPLIALGIIAMHTLYIHRQHLQRYRGVAVTLVAVVTGAYFFIPFFRQRLGEMIGMFGGAKSEHITDNSVNVRKLIWNTDVNLLKHYWLTGIGSGRMLQALHQRYFFHSIHSGYPIGYYDPHSQYFSHWLSFGLAGIGLLLVVLIVQFRQAIKTVNLLYLYLLIILSITFFTETFLARQQGVLFYSVFASLLFFVSLPEKGRYLDK